MRACALAALTVVIAAVAVAPGRGADECRGLMACIPVAHISPTARSTCAL